MAISRKVRPRGQGAKKKRKKRGDSSSRPDSSPCSHSRILHTHCQYCIISPCIISQQTLPLLCPFEGRKTPSLKVRDLLPFLPSQSGFEVTSLPTDILEWSAIGILFSEGDICFWLAYAWGWWVGIVHFFLTCLLWGSIQKYGVGVEREMCSSLYLLLLWRLGALVGAVVVAEAGVVLRFFAAVFFSESVAPEVLDDDLW